MMQVKSTPKYISIAIPVCLFLTLVYFLVCGTNLHETFGNPLAGSWRDIPDIEFDDAGLQIMIDTQVALMELPTIEIKVGSRAADGKSNTSAIATHGSFKVAQDPWWQNLQILSWEKSTFEIFQLYIDQHTTHIDFGTWIGPTLIYGAQLSKRSFGIEADPAAFTKCRNNLNLNSQTNWRSHITLHGGGVCATDGTVEMSARTGAGDSMSSLTEAGFKTRNGETWGVQCHSLQTYFQHWKIFPEQEHTFIKMDVEAYECILVPSLYNWLASMKRKPTIYLAMHSQVASCSKEQYSSIRRFVHLYKYQSTLLLKQLETAIDAPHGVGAGVVGEFILSDQLPSKYATINRH